MRRIVSFHCESSMPMEQSPRRELSAHFRVRRSGTLIGAVLRKCLYSSTPKRICAEDRWTNDIFIASIAYKSLGVSLAIRCDRANLRWVDMEMQIL
jgi:hypothetical protein